MKKIIGVLTNISLWAALGAAAGTQVGYLQGYARGVRDISSLVIELHDAAAELPSGSTKRGVGL